MKYHWYSIALCFAILAGTPGCKRTASEIRLANTTEPPLIVERAGLEGECSVVAHELEGLENFSVTEYQGWAALWRFQGLGLESEDGPTTDAEARALVCTLSKGETGKPACDHAGPLALTIPTDEKNVLLVVQEHSGGVRVVSLGSWPIMCRCDCDAQLEVVQRDPLVVLATEFEHVADDVHFEGDEVVPGCDDPATQDCQTACMGSGYGRQQLIVFDEQLRARDRWTESLEGEDFTVEFGLVEGRVVAQRECTQVLVDRR